MKRLVVLIIGVVVLAVIVALAACGGSARKASAVPRLSPDPAPAQQPTPNVEWPQSLPVDKLQPWESLDGSGRLASSINLQSQFVPGADRFLEAGDVADLGEASRFNSGDVGNLEISYAIYRIPMGAEQPGTVAADVNVYITSDYYIGVADYSANTWRWHGPFKANHVRIPLPDHAYTSTLGNLMLAVVAFDGAMFDLVGLGVNARDYADSTAPDAPPAPVLTPIPGGLLAEWLPVVASDLAGYRVYANGVEALGYVEGGTSLVIPAAGITEVRLRSVDVSGNESDFSEPASADAMEGYMLNVILATTAASGRMGEIIALNAIGGESYDWDVDGDGTYDVTGDLTGTAFVNTDSLGIIRPSVRGHHSNGSFWMAAVSLIISGNSRPVAMATVDIASGPAPLMVNFTIVGEDDDGTIVEYAWDFEGDGIFDATSPVNPTPLPFSYPATGMYNAKFRVTDNDGGWDVDTVAINVAGSLPPVALLNLNTEKAYMGELAPSDEIIFNASASYDPDGGSLEYAWDLDGNGFFTAYSSGAVLSKSYNAPGTYQAAVRVRDSQGMVTEASRQVYVYRWKHYGVDYANSPIRPSLAVSAGYPVFAYYASTTQDLMFAYATTKYPTSASDWQHYAIDTTNQVGDWPSLTVLGDGTLAISYCDYTNGDLRYAYSSSALPTSIGYWTVYAIDTLGDVGTYSSLALRDGFPIISYYDGANADLKFAEATVTNPTSALEWVTHTVDDTDNVGSFTRLSVVSTPTQLPAIAYYDTTNVSLKYACATTSSPAGPGDWVVYTLAAGAQAGWAGLGVLKDPGVTNGNPVVAYTDWYNYDLRIAIANVLEPSDPSEWSDYILDDGDNWYIGLSATVMKHAGRLYVAYNDMDYFQYDLKLAKAKVANPASSSDWTLHTVDSSYAYIDWFGISMAPLDGKVSLAYGNWGSPHLTAFAIPTLE